MANKTNYTVKQISHVALKRCNTKGAIRDTAVAMDQPIRIEDLKLLEDNTCFIMSSRCTLISEYHFQFTMLQVKQNNSFHDPKDKRLYTRSNLHCTQSVPGMPTAFSYKQLIIVFPCAPMASSLHKIIAGFLGHDVVLQLNKCSKSVYNICFCFNQSRWFPRIRICVFCASGFLFWRAYYFIRHFVTVFQRG